MDENVNPIQEEKEKTINEGQTTSTEFDAEDIEKNKTMGGLAYLLFFIPLLACPDSKFGKFHANQSLLLLITNIIGQIVLGFIPFIGWLLQTALSLVVFVFAIKGLVGGLNGKAERIPVVGQYDIIK